MTGDKGREPTAVAIVLFSESISRRGRAAVLSGTMGEASLRRLSDDEWRWRCFHRVSRLFRGPAPTLRHGSAAHTFITTFNQGDVVVNIEVPKVISLGVDKKRLVRGMAICH